MLEQPNLPVSVNIQVDDRYMERFAKAYLDELYQKVLKPEWLTIADLEHITRHKRAWIMEYIVDDPYVRRNGIAKKESDSKNAQWLFDAERIRPFLKRLFDDMEDY
ncbi:DUF771 domain-containing protein [Enterococcus faecium]|uniref:DUF771 domain-containing protein n=1 Tax=Enterococcus faecium TaxID=1352 RepID=UPI000BF14C2C|nr:DUF771 domain-containing protein [Enterococcus faecium]PEH48032.1 hypothetical protein CRM75_09025 [Enterococcus faecium]PEH49335.1 hypothetical protein CRM75_16285 [Enterococcus faecium]